tara:strand:+ start:429 stop:764 length:336 start_codon:yes stop_codon:yes gene_type:complete
MSILEEYKKIRKQSQIKDFDLNYYSIGLGGEVGEVLNEIKKLHRDDNDILTEDRKTKIISEMGDCMWYLQGMCDSINVNIEDIFQSNINKISKNKSSLIKNSSNDNLYKYN